MFYGELNAFNVELNVINFKLNVFYGELNVFNVGLNVLNVELKVFYAELVDLL